MQNPSMGATQQRNTLGLYGQGLPNQGGQNGQNVAPAMNPNPNLAGFGSSMQGFMGQPGEQQQQQGGAPEDEANASNMKVEGTDDDTGFMNTFGGASSAEGASQSV